MALRRVRGAGPWSHARPSNASTVAAPLFYHQDKRLFRGAFEAGVVHGIDAGVSNEFFELRLERYYGQWHYHPMRKSIRKEIEAVVPFDGLERGMKDQALEWVNSGAELCRIEKPATPPQHLVSYFILVDGDYLLLVDHINAKLWPPTGGRESIQE